MGPFGIFVLFDEATGHRMDVADETIDFRGAHEATLGFVGRCDFRCERATPFGKAVRHRGLEERMELEPFAVDPAEEGARRL